MNEHSPIGIFDSGFGGLSVARAVRQLLPGEDICYAADCGFAPWGDRTDDFINRRVDTVVQFLLKKNVKAIVIACNTATAVTVRRLREELSLPIIGIEPAVLLASKESKNGMIGVLATTKTLSSGKYLTLCGRVPDDVTIFNCPCPGLMECVEAGEVDSTSTIALLEGYIEPLLEKGVDTLVLGCTHYPFLQESIRRVAGEDVALIDPAPAVARQLKKRLLESGLLGSGQKKGTDEFFSTDANPAREHILQTLWNTEAKLHPLR